MEKIREYKREDFDEVVKLHFEMAKLERDWLNLDHKLITLENVRQFVESEISEGKTAIFVCESSSKIVGFVTGSAKEKEHSEFYKIKKYFYVDDLYVDPEFRRKGIATKLLKKMEQYAKSKKLKEILLSIAADNVSGMYFYDKLKYKVVEQVRAKEL